MILKSLVKVFSTNSRVIYACAEITVFLTKYRSVSRPP